MISYSTIVRIILFMASFYWCYSDMCAPGWFGPNCEYMCHCAGDAKCDDRGSCSAGCHEKWFGPACQYESIGYDVESKTGTSWLRDRDETTCNDEKSDRLTITLHKQIPLSWIRITVNDAAHVKNIKVLSYVGSRPVPCPEKFHTKVDDRTLDIPCPGSEPAYKLSFEGEGVKHLCSLYISGGRNVALREDATQSSRYSIWNRSAFRAAFAVDGLLGSSAIIEEECSQTGSAETESWWELRFSQEVDITRFIIFGRQDRRERGGELRLTAMPYSREHVPYTHTVSEWSSVGEHTVVPSPVISFPVIRIRMDLTYSLEDELTLCEVFVFGDNYCPGGRYGLGCTSLCNCAVETERCLVHSGGCPSGCAPGYTGENCKVPVCRNGTYGTGCGQICSDTCRGRENPCRQSDGTCSQGCDPGYIGQFCLMKCPIGFYGDRCAKSCNENCAGYRNMCHYISGKCDQGCDRGYQGDSCTQKCDIGFYGEDCKEKCNENCAGDGNPCDHIRGRCHQGCDPGYRGKSCALVCFVGFYGEGCRGNCSEHCAGDENSCHHISGTCDQGCDPGFQGKSCSQECEVGHYGEECKETCSEHCAGEESPCHHIRGECDQGCDPGYGGDSCTKECMTGFFGEGCRENCSEHCDGDENSCHHISGKCEQGCDPGFQGNSCTQECPVGKYGQDCNMTCSVHCAGDDHACNSVTGTCDQGCESGYIGALCSEICPRGRYGPGCNQTCSVQCAGRHRPCHHVDGTCYLGCVRDNQSLFCRSLKTRPISRKDQLQDKDESNQNINVWGITATVVAVVVAVAAAVGIGVHACRQRKRSKGQIRKQSSSDESGTTALELRRTDPAGARHEENCQATSRNRMSNPDHEPVESDTQYVKLYDTTSGFYSIPEEAVKKSSTYEEPTLQNKTAEDPANNFQDTGDYETPSPLTKTVENPEMKLQDTGAYELPSPLTKTVMNSVVNSQSTAGVYEELSPLTADNSEETFQYNRVYENSSPLNTNTIAALDKSQESGTYKNLLRRTTITSNNINGVQESVVYENLSVIS